VQNSSVPLNRESYFSSVLLLGPAVILGTDVRADYKLILQGLQVGIVHALSQHPFCSVMARKRSTFEEKEQVLQAAGERVVYRLPSDCRNAGLLEAGGVVYRSLDGLKEDIGKLVSPRDTLQWESSDVGSTNAPFASSEERDAFAEYCKVRGVRFIIIPGG
jgi:hypothetical protein